MPVQAINDNYKGEVLDAKANFAGNVIIYFGWDEHLMFCAAKAFPLPPQMTFADVISQIMPQAFGQHPEFNDIDWAKAEWQLDRSPISPKPEQTLAELGADHKSCFRLRTPGLTGYKGTGV